MSSLGINNILASYQYAQKTQKAEARQTDFASHLQQVSVKMKNTVNCDMQTFLQNNRNCSLYEFTARYENELEARGISGIDYTEQVKGAESFSDVFSGYQVMEKVGNCKISGANWQRNTSQIGSGKMSIIIPDALQKKMDADPAYAEEIYAKVAKWKDDYDRWDNTTAAALGMDVAEHQFSKSYCLQLDEEGNVEKFTVTSGGGRITQSDDSMVRAWYKRHGIPYHGESNYV